MARRVWIGNTYSEFFKLAGVWAAELKKPGVAAGFGWNEAEFEKVLEAILLFLRAHDAWVESDSTKNRIARDEAMAEAKRLMRSFANSSIRYNVLMNTAAKSVFGILKRDEVPSTIKVIDSWPEGEADTSAAGELRFRLRDSVSGKRGKPAGIHGAECKYVILDHEPLSIEEFTGSEFTTTSRLVLYPGVKNSGKKLYYCFRWESNTNLKGTFSRIRVVTIP